MKENKNLTKLFLLVITVPAGKKAIIADLLEEKFEVTAVASALAYGAYSREREKEVLFAMAKETMVKDAILALEDKFAAFHSNVCMACAIPLESLIGLSSYMFLSSGGK